MTVIYGNREGARKVQDVSIIGQPIEITLPAGGAIDVSVQDPTTDSLILPMAYQLGATTLAVAAIPEAYTMSVTSSAGMTVGNHIRIINTAGDKYYAGTIVSITGNVIGLDSPVDFAYVTASEVTYSTINLAVDGSVTPLHFHLRTGAPSIPSAIDITRIIMVCETSGAVDLNKFGDISGGLTRGLVFRESNGHLRNIFNVKTNRDLVGLAYDFNVYEASNPSQGQNGFAWRLTFGSQGKIGVVIRVDAGGQLGMLVQDDLTSLVTLNCILEGHVVQE